MNQSTTTLSDEETDSNIFGSIFIENLSSHKIIIPNYQRAYSWEKKQVDLFIKDLQYYSVNPKSKYYFGHFISETREHTLEIVDGQQRITTFALFLIICRHIKPTEAHSAYQLIDRFETVNYDHAALNKIVANLDQLVKETPTLAKDATLNRDVVIESCDLKDATFTNSQFRIAQALRQFYLAFKNKQLDQNMIGAYIDVIMTANSSHHQTDDKAVAVNIFEMHNTRGMPLSTMEIVKAKLMKFVYDHSEKGVEQDKNVETIQNNFGEIYQRESLLSKKSFRSMMTLEQLLRHHLRVIDDGTKKKRDDFCHPANNANAEDIIKYLDEQLEKKEKGSNYALDLTEKFLESVKIMSETIPTWDKTNSLVGDALILDTGVSCQFYLLLCREVNNDISKLNPTILERWEKLVFTCDYHWLYHGLNYAYRNNFELLFSEYVNAPESLESKLVHYLKSGFRPGITDDLQTKVYEHLSDHKDHILSNVYNWWKHKFIYSLYKYEKHAKANPTDLRDIMRNSISVEHILPQEWTASYTEQDKEINEDLKKEIASSLHGLGNLLLLTSSQNTSLGKNPPSVKQYLSFCKGGSYSEHENNREDWGKPTEWTRLIKERGELIYDFILTEQLGHKELP